MAVPKCRGEVKRERDGERKRQREGGGGVNDRAIRDSQGEKMTERGGDRQRGAESQREIETDR